MTPQWRGQGDGGHHGIIGDGVVWRTHAILMRWRGMADHLIAKQLGHRDTVLIATRYGRFTPETSEVRGAAGGKLALAASG